MLGKDRRQGVDGKALDAFRAVIGRDVNLFGIGFKKLGPKGFGCRLTGDEHDGMIELFRQEDERCQAHPAASQEYLAGRRRKDAVA